MGDESLYACLYSYSMFSYGQLPGEGQNSKEGGLFALALLSTKRLLCFTQLVIIEKGDRVIERKGEKTG